MRYRHNEIKKLFYFAISLVCLACTLSSIAASALTISEKYLSVFEVSSNEGACINLRKTTPEDLATLTKIIIESNLARFFRVWR